MVKPNENVRPDYATEQQYDDTRRPAYAIDHSAAKKATKPVTTKAAAPTDALKARFGARKQQRVDLMGYPLPDEPEYFVANTSRVQRVTTTTSVEKLFDGFAPGSPMHKGEHGNIAPADANDPTRRAQNTRTQWADPMATPRAGDDWVNFTAQFSPIYTEFAYKHGIRLQIRGGVLCVLLADVPRLTYLISEQATFGTVR